MADEQKKPTFQEIQERKISMAKERGSRVMKVNSPLGATMFNILRQFDMAYMHFKARLGEMDGISQEEGEELMAEGRDIILSFSAYTERLCKKIRFRYYVPREITEFIHIDGDSQQNSP